MPGGRLSIGRDLGAAAHLDVALGGPDSYLGLRARYRVGMGLDDAVQIDCHGVGIAGSLDLCGHRSDGPAVHDFSSGGFLGKNRQFLITCGLE